MKTSILVIGFRHRYDNMADLYAAVNTLQCLEKAYIRDCIKSQEWVIGSFLKRPWNKSRTKVSILASSYTTFVILAGTLQPVLVY